MTDTAIVLAGGFGTRLRDVVKDVPKPMANVAGRPFLEYIFKYLKAYGVKNVLLSIGYLHEVIEDHFLDSYDGIQISYFVEDTPLGTGGAIKAGIERLSEIGLSTKEVIVLNGDTFFDVDLKALSEYHTEKGSDFTLALRPMIKSDRFGTVDISESGRITGFKEKTYFEYGLINGGVYLLNTNLLRNTNLTGSFSLEKDFLEKYQNSCALYGLVFQEYFIDIGIPLEYERAQYDFLDYKY